MRADITFSNNLSKEEFVKKLTDYLQKIPNVQTSLKQENPVIHLECLLEGKSKMVMGLDFYEVD